jgi:hypothetical protein
MRTTKSELMSGVECVEGSAKLAGNNTLRFETAAGAVCFKLHKTVVVTCHRDGRVTLNSGGWRTVTTKARMNQHARPYRVASDRGVWTVYGEGKSVPYFDGITLPDAFESTGKAERAAKSERAKRAKVAAFVKSSLKLGEAVPAPNGGDCWICLFGMDGGPGASPGAFSASNTAGNPDPASCIAEHVKDRYMHGSLVVRACRAAGWTDFRIGLALSKPVGADLQRTVRRFLHRSLGLTA